MANINWSASSRVTNPATILSTTLNSLANGSSVLSTAVENGTSLDLLADFELAVTFTSAPTALLPVEFYIIPSIDGTNYDDTSGGTAPPTSGWGDVFPVRGVATAQILVIRGIELPPRDFKILLKNSAGVAFAASGNTLRGYFYRRSVA